MVSLSTVMMDTNKAFKEVKAITGQEWKSIASKSVKHAIIGAGIGAVGGGVLAAHNGGSVGGGVVKGALLGGAAGFGIGAWRNGVGERAVAGWKGIESGAADTVTSGAETSAAFTGLNLTRDAEGNIGKGFSKQEYIPDFAPTLSPGQAASQRIMFEQGNAAAMSNQASDDIDLLASLRSEGALGQGSRVGYNGTIHGNGPVKPVALLTGPAASTKSWAGRF